MNYCRIYWGSHGCDLERGHEGNHRCGCADDPQFQGPGNVGGYPYYGRWMTWFYGEDAPRIQFRHWLWSLAHPEWVNSLRFRWSAR